MCLICPSSFLDCKHKCRLRTNKLSRALGVFYRRNCLKDTFSAVAAAKIFKWHFLKTRSTLVINYVLFWEIAGGISVCLLPFFTPASALMKLAINRQKDSRELTCWKLKVKSLDTKVEPNCRCTARAQARLLHFKSLWQKGGALGFHIPLQKRVLLHFWRSWRRTDHRTRKYALGPRL